MSEFIMDDVKYVMLPKHDDLIERIYIVIHQKA